MTGHSVDEILAVFKGVRRGVMDFKNLREFEKHIGYSLEECELCRPVERAQSFFGYSSDLKREVCAGRMTTEEADQRRDISGRGMVAHVKELMSNHKQEVFYTKALRRAYENHH